MRVTTFIAFIIGAVLAGIAVKRLWKRKFTEEHENLSVEQRQKNLFYHWLLLKIRGDSVAAQIKKNGAEHVAVFGLESAGRLLIDDLRDSGVTAEYAIENDNPSLIHEFLEVYRLHDDSLPAVEAVIVCPPYEIGDIREELQAETDAKIISLGSIIMEKNYD